MSPHFYNSGTLSLSHFHNDSCFNFNISCLLKAIGRLCYQDSLPSCFNALSRVFNHRSTIIIKIRQFIGSLGKYYTSYRLIQLDRKLSGRLSTSDNRSYTHGCLFSTDFILNTAPLFGPVYPRKMVTNPMSSVHG